MLFPPWIFHVLAGVLAGAGGYAAARRYLGLEATPPDPPTSPWATSVIDAEYIDVETWAPPEEEVEDDTISDVDLEFAYDEFPGTMPASIIPEGKTGPRDKARQRKTRDHAYEDELAEYPRPGKGPSARGERVSMREERDRPDNEPADERMVPALRRRLLDAQDEPGVRRTGTRR